MDIWIQRADSSIEDITNQTSAGVMKAFHEFNWTHELQRKKEIGDYKGVDPGLGLGTYGDAHFIHIIPKNLREAEILYVRSKEVPGEKSFLNKLFGTIPRPKRIDNDMVKQDFPIEQVEDVVSAYFEKNEADLIRLLQ